MGGEADQCITRGMIPRPRELPSVPAGGSPASPLGSTVPASGSRGLFVPAPVPLFPFAGVVTVVEVPVVSAGVWLPPRVQATVPIRTADRANAERLHAAARFMR